jgi:hypothetical protein
MALTLTLTDLRTSLPRRIMALEMALGDGAAPISPAS